MSRPGFLVLVLALSALFFGWRSYEAWTRPVVIVASLPPGLATAPIGVSPAAGPAPPKDFSASVASVVARPLFRPDRKPFSGEAASALPKRNYDSELSRFTLVGVLQIGKDRKGIVVGKGSNAREERWEVSPGDTLPGFNVKELGVEGMTLTADGREFLLPLYAGGPKGQAGQAPVRTEGTPQHPPVFPPQTPSAGQAGSVSPSAQPVRATPFPAVTPPAYSGRRQIRPFIPERPAMQGGR